MVRGALIGEGTRDLSVFGLWNQTRRVKHPEDPGEFSFPPLAATTTAGARLLLAMLERVVTGLSGRDGAYAFCDTDSMAIVSTKEGGLVKCPGGSWHQRSGESVRALSWAQVDEIRERFNALNPYDREAVPDLLKLTDENFRQPKTGSGRRE